MYVNPTNPNTSVKSNNANLGICHLKNIVVHIVPNIIHASNDICWIAILSAIVMLVFMNNNIDVLLDDTEENLSAKFKKFDLIGIPYQIIIGSKSTDDQIEFKEINGKTETLSLEEIKNKLLNKRNLN